MKGVLKKVIIFVVLIIIVVVGYSLFAGEPEIKGSLSATPAAGVDASLSADTQTVLALLQSISNISLNTKIFNRPSYLALEDQSKAIIPDLNPGRNNPFAPIGVDPIVQAPEVDLSAEFNALNGLQDPNSTPSNGSNSSVISTLQASGITKNSAIVRGELISANDSAERYFEYGLSQSSLSIFSNKVVQSTPGFFSYTASNLAPNTTYYFQAVVKVGESIFRGQVQSFKTLP